MLMARKALPVAASEVVNIDDDDDNVVPLDSSPLPANAEKIYVYVAMMTDRERIPAGASEKAIKHWETPRKIYIYRVSLGGSSVPDRLLSLDHIGNAVDVS